MAYPTLWQAAFRALADLPGRSIVVLDEFTHLINGNKAIPSLLQKTWDETLQHTGDIFANIRRVGFRRS